MNSLECQFKALQYKKPEIELDITRANKTTICFESKILFSLISIILVPTSIVTTNFYVINTSTLFFFYLKNINTLGICLGNITNQFIY